MVLNNLIFTATLLRITMKFGSEDYTGREVTNYNLMLNDLRHINPKHFPEKYSS
jgi:hypothetical protein